jgi:hypothetical protein
MIYARPLGAYVFFLLWGKPFLCCEINLLEIVTTASRREFILGPPHMNWEVSPWRYA